MEEKGELAGEKAAAEAGGKGGGKLMPIMLLLNTALMGGVLFYSMKRPAEQGAAGAKAAGAKAEGEASGNGEHGGPAAGPPRPGPILKLENFVIQLKTVDADRYVRLAFDVEVGNEAEQAAVTAYLSPIRDVVISYFADRTLDELRGSEAMERTKATLIKRIDDIVPGHPIRKLYITDFIIQ